MTAIDHQQAAVEAMIEEAKNHRWLTIPDERQECDCGFVISAFPLEYGKDAYKSHVAEAALTAAAPHLRAAWEQEMAEKIRAKFLGPDFGRNPVNGQDSPDAALHAAYDEGLQTALTLLEGGTE